MRRFIFVILAAVVCVGGLFAVFALSGEDVGVKVSSNIRINEIMSSNKGSVPDENGNYPAWIELYNPTDSDIDISGYGLTNSKKKVVKWTFPKGTTIRANGYIVVFCSGTVDGGLLHTTFKLSDIDAVVLTNAHGDPIDSLQLKAVAKGNTLCRDEKGAWAELGYPSPGFPNTEEGAALYRETLQTGSRDNGVRINEIMASNATALSGPFGDYPDWIELYNTTGEEVDLSGCGLSDALDRPMKWVFPDGVSIAPNGFLLIYCSKRDGLIDGELHTSFALSAYKEDVVFSNNFGEVVDSVSFTQLGKDKSLARIPDGTGEFQNMDNATPGAGNQ